MFSTLKKLIRFALFAFLIWLGGLVLFFVTIFLQSPQDIDHSTDAIVVLTGGQSRVGTGLDLFASGKASDLFISGVHKDVSMADITREYAGDVALPPCCITLGYEATTTQQNAQEAREWLETKNYHSIRLVTSDFHMTRSLIELKHALPGVAIIPHPVKQPDIRPKDLYFWIVSLGEYNKTLVRFAFLLFSPRPDITPHNNH